jgi:hypothetical protein
MSTDPAGTLAPRPELPAVDPYAPPAAKLEEPTAPGPVIPRHYVVSARKFWTLELVTTGAYGLVWMYLHWARIKRATRGDEWPVMRSIFQVFFMHSLAADVDQTLRRERVPYTWSPVAVATGAVVLLLASALLDRLPETVIASNPSLALSVALVPVTAAFKWRLQAAANAACADPEGSGNAGFTGANIAWLVAFGLFWLLVAASIALVAWLPQE